jgi:uncharacterized glyoxalase superfamily protein PhnB
MKKLPLVILYVEDQQRSALFYEQVLGQEPLLNVPGMTEFLINENFKLGIMPEAGIARIICPVATNPAMANGIPRCELYLIVENPELSLVHALSSGAREISKASIRDWGDTVAYCMDPDGHILAFAM